MPAPPRAAIQRLGEEDVDTPSEENRTISALEAEVGTLREALTRERERADQAEARAAAERGRVEAAEREREDGRVRAAAAAAEGKGLREALAEARRPLWRRWIGS